MRKFQCLLSELKRSYICYFIICMTVPLIWKFVFVKKESLRAPTLVQIPKKQ